MGAGVPRPVRPKSQTHRNATEKPKTDGTAPIHLQGASRAAATSKPNQPGSSQNHSAKNAAPTANEATVVSQTEPFDSTEGSLVMSDCLGPKYEPRASHQQQKVVFTNPPVGLSASPSLAGPTGRAP